MTSGWDRREATCVRVRGTDRRIKGVSKSPWDTWILEKLLWDRTIMLVCTCERVGKREKVSQQFSLSHGGARCRVTPGATRVPDCAHFPHAALETDAVSGRREADARAKRARESRTNGFNCLSLMGLVKTDHEREEEWNEWKEEKKWKLGT